MLRFVSVSVSSGLLFGLMDGFLNGNPVAQRLYSFWKPVARETFNIPAGILIDLGWGFAMSGLYLLLYGSLPGTTSLWKGLSYALLLWTLRVASSALSQWVMFQVPTPALLYTLGIGLFEMLILGLLYGGTLTPEKE